MTSYYNRVITVILLLYAMVHMERRTAAHVTSTANDTSSEESFYDFKYAVHQSDIVSRFNLTVI